MTDSQDAGEWKIMTNHQQYPIISVSWVLKINLILGLAVKNWFGIWTVKEIETYLLYETETRVQISRNNSAANILVLVFKFKQEQKVLLSLQTVTTKGKCF